jgi:hypothetical protein
MGRRSKLLLCVTLLTALPASAHAAAWTQPLDPCYVSVGPAAQQRQIARIRAGGFAPLAPVDLTVDGVPADTTGDGSPDQIYADPAGQVRVDIRVPYQSDGERPFPVSVSERGAPANAVTANPEVTAVAVTMRPANAPVGQRVRFRGRGFLKHTTIWAHYVFAGKVKKTVRFARRPQGACGTFSVRRRQLPIYRPHLGEWLLQVDQQRRYSATPAGVWFRQPIHVRRCTRTQPPVCSG